MSAPMVIFEPPSAIAASRCLAARIRDPQRWLTTDHPSRCGWCDYPADVIDRMVRGFNDWAGFRERSGTYERHEARVFAELPRDRQREQIVVAQALEEGPPPAPAQLAAAALAQASAPPIPSTPARPDWLGGT